MEERDCVLGIDVGTRAARAAVFAVDGELLASAQHEIALHQPSGFHGYYQQSSEEIWAAVCSAVRQAVAAADIPVERVRALAFDATCSMVVVGRDHAPISVSPLGEPEQNIIVWLDHRATEQAARVNATGHDCLRNVGGKVSPEMEIPKLLWLVENMPHVAEQAEHFLDLADFLAYRATNEVVRSTCTMVCKWNYLLLDPESPDDNNNSRNSGAVEEQHETQQGNEGFQDDFLAMIGLHEFVSTAQFHGKINGVVCPPGTRIASGLSERAALELGLSADTTVAVGIIDAHAGGVGAFACRIGDDMGPEVQSDALLLQAFERRMAIIAGTSTCHMITNSDPLFVPGVWGPYKDAMIPSMYLNEGGQSVAGALLDHIIETHPAFPELQQLASQSGLSVHSVLHQRIENMAQEQGLESRESALLAAQVHVYPDFAGNRSPLADPDMRGMIVGLTLARDLSNLAVLYLATIQALAYGSLHITEQVVRCRSENSVAPPNPENSQGASTSEEEQRRHRFSTVLLSGGLSRNPLYVREHSDAMQVDVVLPNTDAMLTGSAILAAAALGHYPSVLDAMQGMSRSGIRLSNIIPAASARVLEYHRAKYQVFKQMAELQLSTRSSMTPFSTRPR